MAEFSTISCVQSTWKSAGSEMNQRSRVRVILSLSVSMGYRIDLTYCIIPIVRYGHSRARNFTASG